MARLSIHLHPSPHSHIRAQIYANSFRRLTNDNISNPFSQATYGGRREDDIQPAVTYVTAHRRPEAGNKERPLGYNEDRSSSH